MTGKNGSLSGVCTRRSQYRYRMILEVEVEVDPTKRVDDS